MVLQRVIHTTFNSKLEVAERVIFNYFHMRILTYIAYARCSGTDRVIVGKRKWEGRLRLRVARGRTAPTRVP